MTHGMQGTGLSLGTCTGWQHVAGLSWAWLRELGSQWVLRAHCFLGLSSLLP